MAIFHPFQALRPTAEEAPHVAALPYDVVTRKEAEEIGRREPHSFLHVDCAEIDLEGTIDSYSQEVYAKAASNLKKLEREGILVQDTEKCFYIYQLIRKGKAQTGVVGVCSIDDYLNGIIRRHELTRKEKEQDRVCHVEVCSAQTGPIFLTYREKKEVQAITSDWMKNHVPVYDFVDEYGIGQKVWVVDDQEVIQVLADAFGEIPSMYIADGHHRAAAAVRTGLQRRKENQEASRLESDYFLGVAFPEEELTILPYNRVVRDLNGLSVKAFLGAVKFNFELMIMPGGFPCLPIEKHCIGMYVDGQWYHLKAWPDLYEGKDVLLQLDVELLQDKVLCPVLGIENPRVDERISFVGGNVKARDLAAMADATGGAAFVMYPTSIEDLMSIADAGEVMPPKSTWFEPKLRSGLFIHKI